MAPKPQEYVETYVEYAVPAAPLESHGRSRGPPIDGVDGAWKCFQCGNVNFAMRDSCNRCGTARQIAVHHAAPPPPPPAQAWAAAPQPPQHHSGGKGGRPIAGVNGNWECPQCGNVNFAVRDSCNRCQAPRPVDGYLDAQEYGALDHGFPGRPVQNGSGAKGPPVAGVDGNWSCPYCQNINFGVRTTCNRCGMEKVVLGESDLEPAPQAPPQRGAKRGPPVAGVDGNWACPSCQNVNFAVRTACNRCGAPKPELDSMGGLGGELGGEPDAKRTKTEL